MALREFETAEKAFLKSIQLNPQSWEGHYNLAELYMSAKLIMTRPVNNIRLPPAKAMIATSR